MGKIFLLDETTINKIAAGEVIERPASIVKELAENSIDAGATSITIEIEEGGKSYINVSDNGCGIMHDDVERAFFRHATSKIKDSKDLSGIETLGFRGEALASIAAVSELEMKTRAEEDPSGNLILLKGGKVIEINDIGYPIGTSIIVRNLFFNTPARLKFLKSDTSEQGQIVNIVEKLALTNTGISFKLTVNNKVVLHTPGNGDLLSVILCIYGKNTAKAMLPLDYSSSLVNIQGYIGKPETAKGNSTYMTFSINNRYVKNRLLGEAVRQAYKTLLMNNRYPFSVINIDIKSDMIDVNVHPTKQEVKFSDDRAIFNTLYIAVKNCLNSNQLIFETLEETGPERYINEPAASSYQTDVRAPGFFDKKTPGDVEEITFDQIGINTGNDKPHHNTPFLSRKSYEKKAEKTACSSAEEQERHNITIIGSLFGTFILGQSEDNFYIIDQHAAHERVMYEYIKEKYNTKSITMQELIMPIIVELSPAEKVLYAENSLLFQNLGFETEWFGENALAIRSIPIIMGEPCSGEFFGSILDSLKETGSSIESPLDKIVISMACKNAVKAGDKLTPEEIEELIDQLFNTNQPFTCPHGRPTIITMSKYDLEKKFKRIL